MHDTTPMLSERSWVALLKNATRVRQMGGTTDKARMKHLREVLRFVPAELYGASALWLVKSVRRLVGG